MRKRRQIEIFSISFLDLLSGALGAVIILYVAIPKNQPKVELKDDIVHDALRADLIRSGKKIEELEEQLATLKSEASLKAVAKEDISETVSAKNLDIGFKFKGNKIVFIIDTSYSMFKEDRMGQVKAGLKMFITSLPANYQVEVVQFPLGERAPFRSMWGTIRETTNFNKDDIFQFIYSLKPNGGTPTRDVLMFVLENYDSISDIVLLTDGQPTYHNSNKKDDIYDILRVVREKNVNKVQINTIGVGANFVNDKSSEQFKFLSLLSQEHGGFFVGF